MYSQMELKKENTILVADDDPTLRLLLSETLKLSGFTVCEAKTGTEALRAFEQHKPDLILLDVMMPEMDGFEVCSAIRRREEAKHVPILMVTGVNDLPCIQKAYEAGATDFITKPLNTLILTERVRYMLRASRAFFDLKRNQEILADAQRIARLGSWEFDVAEGTFMSSPQSARICGVETDSWHAQLNDFLGRVHPEDRQMVQSSMLQAIHQGRPFTLDHRILLPEGSTVIVSLRVETHLHEDGSVSRLTGTLQDITERKMSEIFEADRNRVLQMVVQDLPLSEILMHIVGILERQRPEARASLSLVQDGRLQIKSAPKLAPGFTQTLDGRRIGMEVGCCGPAAYLGQPIVAEDISISPFWRKYKEAALAHGLRSCFSVPIFSGKGRVLGTIALYHETPYRPANADLELAAKLSKLAAVAIEQRHLSELLVHQAQHDSLTGLVNRGAFHEQLKLYLEQTSRYGSLGALLLIDLDRFKMINDSLGHQAGDALLCQVAQRLKDCCRKSDALARIGGDEFVLMLCNIKADWHAGMTAERVLEKFRAPFEVLGHQLHIGASVGICCFPQDGSTAEGILRNADSAMYVAKNEGGGRFRYFDVEMDAAAVQRLEMENDLRKGLERGEFELHYQPQYDLQDGSVVATEALLRWNHPSLGRIPPGKFIPVAEDSRLIIPIGSWVIREACRQNAAWQNQGYPPIRIAVNVSAVQFTDNTLAQTVKNALEESGLDPKWLEIEITESVVLGDLGVVRQNFARLKEMGIMTTIDDFGTGYSSITYLKQMPLDRLKIDKSFIRDLNSDGVASHRTRTLIKAFVSLAQNLGLSLVAEGIENQEQQSLVTALGCNLGQGFLFSVPLPADEVVAIFERRQFLAPEPAVSKETVFAGEAPMIGNEAMSF